MSNEHLGYVAEGARRREVFAKYIGPRVAGAMSAPALQREIDAEVARRVREEVARIVAQRTADQVAGVMVTGVPRPHMMDLWRLAAAVTGEDFQNLMGPRRAPKLARARHFAIWLSAQMRPDLSLAAIGRFLGRHEHSAISHGVKMTELRMATDETVQGWMRHTEIVALLAGRK